MTGLFKRLGALAAFWLIATGLACAQDNFYADKTIELILPANSGSYHTYALLLADHLPRHIAGNPPISPVSMGGAGGIRASNFVANVAAKDGTVLYMMHQNAPSVELLTPDKVQYKSADFQPIGICSALNSVFAARIDSGLNTIADAKQKEIILGATGVGSYTYFIPAALNDVVGTKFKIVSTYPGNSEMMLAFEQGEIAAMMTSFASVKDNHPEWVAGTGTGRLLMQVGGKVDPAIPDVPLLIDLAQNDKEKSLFRFMSLTNAFARSLVAPAGVPVERVELLRKAFTDMMADPDFIADAKKRGIELSWGDSADLKNGIDSVLSTPADVIAIAREFVKD